MKRALTIIFLALSGLLLLAIAGSILLTPQAFYAGDGIILSNDPSLLSEIRAPGGLLAGSGVLILLGILRPKLRSQSTSLSILVYGSYGLSRLLGFAFNGLPSNELLVATAVEFGVAVLGLIILALNCDIKTTAGASSYLPSSKLEC